MDRWTYSKLQQIVPLCHFHSESSSVNGLVRQETIPYAKTSQAEHRKEKDKQIFCMRWLEWLPDANPFFQQLSACNILRSRKRTSFDTYKQEEEDAKRNECHFMTYCKYSTSMRATTSDIMLTSPYSIDVESITSRELDKVTALSAYYLHMHDCGICSLLTVKYRIRRFCTRERTTNADSICVMVSMARKRAPRLTNTGLTIQNFCSTIDSAVLVGIQNLPSHVLKFVRVTTSESVTHSVRFKSDTTDNLKWGSGRLGNEELSHRATLSISITTHDSSQRNTAVSY